MKKLDRAQLDALSTQAGIGIERNIHLQRESLTEWLKDNRFNFPHGKTNFESISQHISFANREIRRARAEQHLQEQRQIQSDAEQELFNLPIFSRPRVTRKDIQQELRKREQKRAEQEIMNIGTNINIAPKLNKLEKIKRLIDKENVIKPGQKVLFDESVKANHISTFKGGNHFQLNLLDRNEKSILIPVFQHLNDTLAAGREWILIGYDKDNKPTPFPLNSFTKESFTRFIEGKTDEDHHEYFDTDEIIETIKFFRKLMQFKKIEFRNTTLSNYVRDTLEKMYEEPNFKEKGSVGILL